MAVKTFEAELLRQGPGGAWTHFVVPFDVEREFGSRARVPVRGTMNGFPFRSSIFPLGDGRHSMMVNAAMREGARAEPGEVVTVTMERDDEPRPIEVPAELKTALNKDAAARAAFEALPPSHRREIAGYVDEAKRPETRLERAARSVATLLGRGAPAALAASAAAALAAPAAAAARAKRPSPKAAAAPKRRPAPAEPPRAKPKPKRRSR